MEHEKRVLNMVADDMQNDVEEYEELSFTGKNVAEFNGKQNAAMQALAIIINTLICQLEKLEAGMK